ncbi:MAG: SAM-dependent methyltransferase [Elusimicrobia bacterium RIFOXYB2_FULL_49_7]|nr:MAG: SAM-dependent methyltransferase [Elusimicrobia bacterium RIFOXYB2_FULL_49_7]
MNELICRGCLSELRAPFLSLGNQPLSNAYLTAQALQQMEATYPLDLYHCEKCHLVQLPEFEKAADIFNEEYAYFSSYSTSWLDHCKRYADIVADRFKLGQKSFVMEVASNDGYLLQYFKEKEIPVLGVEPAAATAKVAQQKGIPTEICFFDSVFAKQLVSDGRLADLIAGNNVLAHNPNLREFVEALAMALKPEGVITLEFPHVLSMIQENQFDTIYHEHFSYLGLLPLIPLFQEFGLTLFDVDELPTHGGSLRIYAAHTGAALANVSPSVQCVLEKEKVFGLDQPDRYAQFTAQVETVKRNLLRFLIDAKETGKKVAGYGAPAKGNTLLNYCGIRTDLLPFTVDRNPHKSGRFLPGTHIPIFSVEKIKAEQPDFLFILPWNLKKEVMEQMAFIREWGGRFVVAIPSLQVLE